MVHVAVNPPSVVVTVITAVPTARPTTRPVDEMEAIHGRLEDHDTVLVVALMGSTVGTSVNAAVRGRVNVVRLRDTLVTGRITRTITDADLFPSCVVTVMIVDPFPTAVISPLLDTVAMDDCKDLHETFLLVAFDGRTVAID